MQKRVWILLVGLLFLVACGQKSREEIRSLPPSQDAGSQGMKGCVEETPGNWCFSGFESPLFGDKICGTKDQCIVMSAQQVKDIAQCAEVQDQGTRNACVLNVALGLQDASVCNQLVLNEATDIDNCYVQFAQQTSDPSACAFVKNPAFKQMCLNPPPVFPGPG